MASGLKRRSLSHAQCSGSFDLRSRSKGSKHFINHGVQFVGHDYG